MGEGFRRLFLIAVALATAKGGTLLIDEIENGLHYSVLKDVWNAIAQAARQADVQVFATTHGYECIEAAQEVFSASDEYDFRLHRLDRVDDGIKAVTYDQEALGAATKFFMEVR